MITPTKKLILVLIGLFIGEAAIMALINFFRLPAFAEAIADASVLILIALPILYFQFARPMIQQYHAIEKANWTAEMLLKTSTELAKSLDLDQVIDILLRQIKTLIPFDFAAVYMLQSPDRLVLRAAWRNGRKLDHESIKSLVFNLRDHPALLNIYNGQKSLVIPNTQLTEEPFFAGESSQLCGWLGIPLVAGGNVIGIFELGRMQPAEFSQDQVRIIDGIASQAAVAIQNAEHYEQVRVSREQLKMLAGKFVEVQERERRLIARDLQEDFAQTIAAALMQVRFLEDKTDRAEIVRSGLEDIDQKLELIFKDLRKMAVDLRPSSLDTIGLKSAISQYLNKLQGDHCPNIYIDILDLSQRLPERTETILYRITQEALSNVVHHAQASRINVSLIRQDTNLALIVEDDGVGFNPENIDQTACLGLIDMRERAEMIGGKLDIESSEGKGTIIQVTIPYE